MSRTPTVVFGDRGSWAVDDAFAVWLPYLVEVLNDKEPLGDQSTIGPWRVASPVTAWRSVPSPSANDGVSPTLLQRRGIGQEMRGTSPSIDSGQGISSDLPVSGGFSRTGALLMDDIDPGVD